MRKSRGNSLLELVIITAITSIIMVNIVMVLNVSKIYFEKYYVKNELFSSGKLVIEFINIQFEKYDNFEITYYENKILKKITIYKDGERIESESNVLEFINKRTAGKDKTISFGGKDIQGRSYTNTLSDNIENVLVYIEGNKIIFKITVKATGKEEEYKFRLVINAKGKNVKLREVKE